MRGKGPKSVDHFMPGSLHRTLHRTIGRSAGLYPVWAHAVGPELATHSRPLTCVGGCLTVQTDSPVWATYLRQRQPAIIKSVREASQAIADIGPVDSLRVTISPTARQAGPAGSATRRPNPVSEQNALYIKETADNIEDPELRSALERLGAHLSGNN